MIRTALAQNYDLRIAVARILQAQSQVTIARSQEFPTVDGSVSAPYAGYSGLGPSDHASRQHLQPQAGFDVAWELDFWGKFRRNTESARADLLATDEARYVVMATLVTQVADAYLTLRALDLTLEISQTHRELPRRSPSTSCKPGWTAAWPGCSICGRPRRCSTARRRRSRTSSARSSSSENFISILLGQNPGPIKRGRPLDQQIAAPTLPPGLPLDLLTRRPDIRQAEQQLVSANAQIGVAKALLYPQVTISGFAGVGGATINGSNFGPFGIFSALPAITLPIFNMGRLQANVDYNEAVAQQAGLHYQQTLQQALREVSDALVGDPQTAGIPAAAGTARHGAGGREPGRQHALRGRGVQLPRSPGYGASALRGGTRSGPGEARRVVERDRSSTRHSAEDGRPSRPPRLPPTELDLVEHDRRH